MRCEIGGELVEISLGNRSCDPQEFIPDRHTLPLGSAGRCPSPPGRCTRCISFSICCHIVIIAKTDRWHKEATECPAHLAESDEDNRENIGRRVPFHFSLRSRSGDGPPHILTLPIGGQNLGQSKISGGEWWPPFESKPISVKNGNYRR